VNRFKVLIPHLLILSIFALILIYGLVTNNPTVGTIYGTLAALSTDPLILFFAIIAGLFNFRTYRKFVMFIILISVIMLAIINYNVSQFQAEIGVEQTLDQKIFINTLRIAVLLVISHIINIPVKVFFEKKNA